MEVAVRVVGDAGVDVVGVGGPNVPVQLLKPRRKSCKEYVWLAHMKFLTLTIISASSCNITVK